jgi:hypothetical protein
MIVQASPGPFVLPPKAGEGVQSSEASVLGHGVQPLALGEADLPVLGVYDDLIALGELPLQDLVGDGVLDQSLEGPHQRTRPVLGIVPLLDEQLFGFFRDGDEDLALA